MSLIVCGAAAALHAARRHHDAVCCCKPILSACNTAAAAKALCIESIVSAVSCALGAEAKLRSPDASCMPHPAIESGGIQLLWLRGRPGPRAASHATPSKRGLQLPDRSQLFHTLHVWPYMYGRT